MSTIEHHRLIEGVSVQITDAERTRAYVIRLRFSDGTSREVDFEPFLKASAHPEIHAYLDANRFAGFSIKDGDLVWGDYEMCFPIADLYEGNM